MNTKLLEALADIAYLAGQHYYYSGDSRDDMQTFIFAAQVFETKYANVDWNSPESPDYMETIEAFTIEHLKLTKKLDLGYMDSFEGDWTWDNVEIDRCRDDNGNTYTIDDDTDIQPNDFWSVYLHKTSGGVVCIADVPTVEQANDLKNLITSALATFKDNNFFTLSRNTEAHRKFNLFIDDRISMASSIQTRAAYEVVKEFFNGLIKV